jgi:hypothetical protein
VCAISAAQQLVYFWCGEKEREGGCVMLYFTFTDKNAHIIFGGVFKMPERLADWFWLCLVLVWWCVQRFYIYFDAITRRIYGEFKNQYSSSLSQ